MELEGLAGTDPVIDRELYAHATGMGSLSGFSLKSLFKAAAPIIPIASAALAPFTGGASLAVGGALTAVTSALNQPGAPAAPAPIAPPVVVAPPPPPVPAAPASGNSGMLILGGLALLLLFASQGRRR